MRQEMYLLNETPLIVLLARAVQRYLEASFVAICLKPFLNRPFPVLQELQMAHGREFRIDTLYLQGIRYYGHGVLMVDLISVGSIVH